MHRDQRDRNSKREEQTVILDKSFVRGASGKQVREICENYRALMPEDLLFELLHSDEETKKKCFAKFPAKSNPVGLLPPAGVLIRYENENRTPATPIWNHRLDKDFQWHFNDKLALGEFAMTHQQLEAVRKWEEDLAVATAMFAERAKAIIKVFPVLEGFRPGQDRKKIEEVLSHTTSKMGEVRRFYKWVAPEGFAPAPIVGRTWTVFRYMQVHLFADVEFLAKYGVDVNRPNQEILENERADLNYLLLSILAGGLASDDKAMKRRFKSLCPRGLLIEVERGNHATKPKKIKWVAGYCLQAR